MRLRFFELTFGRSNLGFNKSLFFINMSSNFISMDKPILLFDGSCNLCSRGVQFFLKRDKKRIIYYASLQSNLGQSLLEKFNLPLTKFDSLVFVIGQQYWQKTDAVIKASSLIGGRYHLLLFCKIIPGFLRDFCYSIVAENRYRWFGKSETCFLPEEKYKQQFLD